MKNSKIQVLGAHIQVSQNLHMKVGSSTWYRFLATVHTRRHTRIIFLHVKIDSINLSNEFHLFHWELFLLHFFISRRAVIAHSAKSRTRDR